MGIEVDALTLTFGGASSGGAETLFSRVTLDGFAANENGSGSGSGGGTFELSFEARRRENSNDDAPPEHAVGLRLTACW